jgi:hypothetical protein
MRDEGGSAFEYLLKENGKNRYSNKGKDGYNNKKDDPPVLPFFIHLFFGLHP